MTIQLYYDLHLLATFEDKFVFKKLDGPLIMWIPVSLTLSEIFPQCCADDNKFMSLIQITNKHFTKSCKESVHPYL